MEELLLCRLGRVAYELRKEGYIIIVLVFELSKVRSFSRLTLWILWRIGEKVFF